MPRYDDHHGNTRLFVGHLSSRTRARDLEDLFSRYGRVRDVDMKRDYAFVEFSDPRDADDARYNLDGRGFDGSRLIVEFAKGHPRGGGGGGGSSREYLGRGPAPGSGRCFNCGIDGHWARDCKAGDWKNKCYRCGERGHIEKDCKNSPKSLKRGNSYSRSPSPRPRRSRRSRSRSFSHSRSFSRSRSPAPRRGRERSIDREEKRSRSPRSRVRKHSSSRSPDSSRSPKGRSMSPPVRAGKKDAQSGSDDSRSPIRNGSRSRSRSRGPVPNGRSHSPIDYKDDEGINNNASKVSPSASPQD